MLINSAGITKIVEGANTKSQRSQRFFRLLNSADGASLLKYMFVKKWEDGVLCMSIQVTLKKYRFYSKK